MSAIDWLNSLSRMRRWMLLGGAVVFIFVLGMLAERYHLRSPFGASSGESAVSRPKPAEFLYLDNERVGAYLAQLNGGIAKSERLTEMLRTEDSAKVAGGDVFAVGASAQHENFVERQVSPTAAANFFRLLAVLRQQEEIEDVEVGNLRDFKALSEGSFVIFRSRDLRTPVYANSYLVVRQAGTMKALFPTAGLGYGEREAVEDEREAARSFAHQVGPNPRIVFALTPTESDREKKEREKREAGGPAERLAAKRSKKDEEVKFLLPVRYRQLTDERSLIKDGGGSFRVVGKLVRVFRGPEGKEFAYRDSPTWETWRSPLEHVPGLLLERSSRLCETESGANEANQLESPEDLRKCVLKRLRQQTEIPKAGAVILPIAIYK